MTASEIARRIVATAAAPAQVVVLDAAEQSHRRDLRAHRQVSRQQDQRSVLADRSREGERRARRDRGGQGGQHDAPERRQSARSEGGRRLFGIAIELGEDGLHGAHDERQGHEQERQDRRPAACSAMLTPSGLSGP